MKKTLRLIAAIFMLTALFCSSLRAQDDCCGMGSIFQSLMQSGIYGGYGFQQFSAKGLDLIVDATPQIANDFEDYGFAHGWRVGANIIGVRYQDVIMSLKFHYQSVAQSQENSVEENNEIINRELKLELRSWSVGTGLSYVINNNFDLRIFDLLMTFSNTKLTYDVKSNSVNEKDVYESPTSQIGFAFDTGLVFYPAPPYVAIELLGGYSFFTIEEVQDENNDTLNTPEDFVDGGGFFAVAVLTIGIPFN